MGSLKEQVLEAHGVHLVRDGAEGLVSPFSCDTSWGAPGPYELLALLLLEVAKGARTPLEAGEEAGRASAGSCPPGADPLTVLETEMARRGFEPRRENQADLTEIVLERCPFVAAASAEPDVVCAVHQGLAAGILDGMQSGHRVRQLIGPTARARRLPAAGRARAPGAVTPPDRPEHPAGKAVLILAVVLGVVVLLAVISTLAESG